MHSADFRVEKMDLESYLGRIKDLGQALKTHSTEFSELAEEIEQVCVRVLLSPYLTFTLGTWPVSLSQLQNTDFSFIVNWVGKEIALAADEDAEGILKRHNFLSLEQQILKEKLECLSQRYEEDRETALTVRHTHKHTHVMLFYPRGDQKCISI